MSPTRFIGDVQSCGEVSPAGEGEPIRPEPERDPVTAYRKYKRRMLLGIAVLAVIIGGVAGTLEDDAGFTRPVRVLFGISLSILVASWCHCDALEHGRRLGGLMRVGLLLLWVVVFPVYAFRTRGLGGFKLTALAILVFCGTLALMVCSGLLVAGIATLAAPVD